MKLLTIVASSALAVLLLLGVTGAVAGLPDAIHHWTSEPEDALALTALVILGTMGSVAAGANAYVASLNESPSRVCKLAIHVVNICFLVLATALVLAGAAIGPNSTVEKVLLFPPLIIVGLGYWQTWRA